MFHVAHVNYMYCCPIERNCLYQSILTSIYFKEKNLLQNGKFSIAQEKYAGVSTDTKELKVIFYGKCCYFCNRNENFVWEVYSDPFNEKITTHFTPNDLTIYTFLSNVWNLNFRIKIHEEP